MLKRTLIFLLPQRLLTKLLGLAANIKALWFKNLFIKLFIRMFHVELTESVKQTPAEFYNFNDFFTRKLKANARQLADSDLISPCDGQLSFHTHLANSTTAKDTSLYAKRNFKLSELLGNDPKLIEKYTEGSASVFYLAPKDYHRFHSPVSGKVCNMQYYPGSLEPVNPKLAMSTHFLSKNERVLLEISTPSNTVCLVFVAALVVGGIELTDYGVVGKEKKDFVYKQVHRGDELGMFKLGSSIVMLTQQPHVPEEVFQSLPQTIKMGAKCAKYAV